MPEVARIELSPHLPVQSASPLRLTRMTVSWSQRRMSRLMMMDASGTGFPVVAFTTTSLILAVPFADWLCTIRSRSLTERRAYWGFTPLTSACTSTR